MNAAAAPPGSDGDGTAAGLLGLHLALQGAGFVVGPRELLLATQLLVRLQQVGQWSEEPARLKPLLSAVYCKSRSEQSRFGAVFDRWLQGRPAWRTPATEAGSTVTRVNPLAPTTVAQTAPWQRWVTIAVVTMVAAGVAWRAWHTQAPPRAAPPSVQAPVVEPVEAAAPSTPSAAARPASAAAMEGATPAGHAGFEPRQLLQREFRPWVAVLLLALPLPLLLLVYAPALALSRRHLDRQRQHSGVKLDVSAWRTEAERVVPVMEPQTAARLDRHVRAPFDDAARSTRRMLDATRTLAATLRHHGQLTLRWRARRTRPSYLVLIDTRDENDLRGRLFFRWADRLRREGVNVEIWLFNGDPRVLYPAHQRRVLDASGAERSAVRFEQVAQRAASESVARLVLVSDGAGFFDAAGALQEWWPGLAWQRWAERVMFTPVDSRDWGEREVAIERPLGRADPGFLVLPLEAEALDAYAVQLTQGELPGIVLSGARRFPTLLDKLEQGGLAQQPPPPAEVEKLIAQLRLYLGENGLRWLAACAVPPVSRWELTLLIGQELFRDMGAADEEQLRWLMQSNYARLARLPWLRNASFPDWLALRLLDELSPPVQQRIRQVVRRLLDQVPTAQAAVASDVLTLDCSPPGGGGGAAWAEGRTPPDETQRRRQWLYLGFLDGLTPRQLALRAPRSWRQWLAAPRGVGRGWREWFAFVGDWLRALLARLMWRDGRAEGGVSWWPLALSLAWLVGCGFALQRLAQMPPGDMAPALAQALFVDKRIDAGVVSDVPYRLIAFSGDGRRFATADDAGEIQVRYNDTRAELVAEPMQQREPPAALFLDPQGERLVVVDSQGRARRKDLVGRWLAPIQVGPATGFSPANVVMDALRERVAAWNDSGQLVVTTLATGRVTRVDVAGDGPQMQVVFKGQGLQQTQLAVLRGGTRSLIDPASGQRLDRPNTTPPVRALGLPADAPTRKAPAKALQALRQVQQASDPAPALPPRSAARQRWLSPDGDTVVVAYDEGVDIVAYSALERDGRTSSLGRDGRTDFVSRDGLTRVRDPDGMAQGLGAVVSVDFDAQGGVKLLDEAGRLVVWDTRRGVVVHQGQVPAPPAAASGVQTTLPPLKFVAAGSVLLQSGLQERVRAWAAPGPADFAAADLSPPSANLPEANSLGPGLTLSARPALLEAHGDDLISTDANHELRLWRRAATQELPRPANLGLPQRDAASAVAISADGRWAASGDADGFVQVWEVRSGRLRTRIDSPHSAVRALVLSADATQLVILSADGRARAWDAVRGVALGEPVGQRLVAQRFAASRDGTRLLAWSGGNVQQWRLEATGLRAGAQVQGAELAHAALDERTAQFLTARPDGQVTVWSGVTGGRVSQFNALPPSAGPCPGSGCVPSGSSARPAAQRAAAAAPGSAAAASVPSVTLPNVQGRPLAAARQTLTELGFAIRVSGATAPTRAQPGTVVQLAPGAGTALRRGSTVQLVVAGSACRSGFVERGAFGGDTACVTPPTRDQAQRDNAAAASRVDPKNQSFGAATCQPGYVWREADRPRLGEKFADKVCVTPAVRQQTAQDNADQVKRIAEGFGFQPARTAPAPAPAPVAPPAVQERLQQAHFVVDRTGRSWVLVRSNVAARLFGLNPPQPDFGPAVTHPDITAAAFSPQDGMLITGGADGRLRFWNAETGVESLPALRQGAPITRLAVTADGRHALSTHSGSVSPSVWNLAARRGLPPLTPRPATPGSDRPWVDFALDGTGTHVVRAGNDAPAGAAVRLPDFLIGELRVVRPYALFWLGLLGLVVLGGIVVLVQAVRKRTRLIERLVAGVGNADAGPLASAA